HARPARAAAWFATTLAVGVVPITATAGAAIIVHACSPRRIFDVRALRSSAAGALGVVSGLLALTLGGLLAATFDPWVNNATWLAGTSLFSACIVLVTLARRRMVGCCAHCDYDISASLAYGRCPECGMRI